MFAPEFDNRGVDLEGDSESDAVGDLSFVAHADRPAVSGFMEAHADSTLFINGVLVPSIAHEKCMHLMMTGSGTDGASDWPALLAADQASLFPLPHIVISGPSFPGEMGGVVTRTGSSGQLESLLSGDIIDWSDVQTQGPGARAEEIMDGYLQRRAAALEAAANSTRDVALLESYASSLDRAIYLKSLQGIVDWYTGTTLADQTAVAVKSLYLGLSRCATLSYTGYGWDSHTRNDYYQNLNFEGLFSGLGDLMAELAVTPGEESASLLEETVVVVLSEMGRTPKLNDADGKDHWPYTSVMITGPGVTGGRVVGGFDELFYGKTVDPDTAELDESGIDVTASSVGATLLNLADIDHEDYLPGVEALPGVLE